MVRKQNCSVKGGEKERKSSELRFRISLFYGQKRDFSTGPGTGKRWTECIGEDHWGRTNLYQGNKTQSG